jgi:cysteinyl-tRNA synthetase
LADDFNTPRALAEAFELVAEANRGDAPGAAASAVLSQMLDLVGLSSLTETGVELKLSPSTGRSSAKLELTTPQLLLARREEARAAKDYERADEIRDQLLELGWEVRDLDSGPRLIRKA